jgi:hypothetical protein
MWRFVRVARADEGFAFACFSFDRMACNKTADRFRI